MELVPCKPTPTSKPKSSRAGKQTCESKNKKGVSAGEEKTQKKKVEVALVEEVERAGGPGRVGKLIGLVSMTKETCQNLELPKPQNTQLHFELF